MKKLIVLVLAMICVLTLAGCNNRSMNYIIQNEPSITGIVKTITNDALFIENESGEYWVSLEVESEDSMTHFSTGDEVVVYYDGNIAETYPMQINKVYAITLKDRSAEERINRQSVERTMPSACLEDTGLYETIPMQTEPQNFEEDQNTDFYSVCTRYSKSEVEQFAKEVREMILSEAWAELSERVAFPIRIGGITYEDSTSFLTAPFETHLDANSIDTIRNENCTDMFCNYSGIMMGNGEVWLAEVLNEDDTSAGLRVIALHIINPA